VPNKNYYKIYNKNPNNTTTITIPNTITNQPSYGQIRSIGVIATTQAIYNNLGSQKILIKIIGKIRC
jgi:hypothetical protein